MSKTHFPTTPTVTELESMKTGDEPSQKLCSLVAIFEAVGTKPSEDLAMAFLYFPL